MIQNNPLAFLKNQLEKPSEDSKKWRVTIIGLKGIAGFFTVGAILIFIKPDIASEIATLVQFVVTAWSGIIGIYLGAQGSVDFKTTAAIEKIQENTTITENITTTEKYDPLTEQKYQDKFSTDESYRPIATIPDAKVETFR